MSTEEPIKGRLLIAEPFLKDPNFMRTVILLCEVAPKGSFGFVLNKPANASLGELVAGLEHLSMPVFYGGPVQENTLHFLHTHPELISGGLHIIDNVYWGGDFAVATELITSGKISIDGIRFYLGYSGWTANQLQDELKEISWVVSPAKSTLIFHQDIQLLWKDALWALGGDYKLLVNAPIDPQLN